MAASWRVASDADLEALRRFALGAEPRAINLTHRYFDLSGTEALPAFRSGKKGFLAIRESVDGPDAAILCHPHGTLVPFVPAPRTDRDRQGMSKLVASSSFVPRSALGDPVELDLACGATGRSPALSVSYRFMRLDALARGAEDGQARWATEADLDVVYPLRERYEREEVVTKLHVFDADGCRAALRRMIQSRSLVVALSGSRVVGTAAINGRGFGWEQIGGVWVERESRGKGNARAMMAFALADVFSRGKRACLFVKTRNERAMSLYDSLGFRDAGPFEIRYFI